MVCVWCMIFLMWPVGIILGFWAVIRVIVQKRDCIPFTFKLLIGILCFYLFIGSIAAVGALLKVLNCFQQMDGADKAQFMALGISNTLYLTSFTLLGTVPFMVAVLVAFLIMHFRKYNMTQEEFEVRYPVENMEVHNEQ